MNPPRRYRFLVPFLERSLWGHRILVFISRHGRLFHFLETVAIAFVLAWLITTFVVQNFRIPSPSMEPTLQVGDQILVWKFTYRFRNPHVGEIVVFRPPDTIYSSATPHYIKRVVGLPGTTLELVREPGDSPRFGHVHLDGHRVDSVRWISEHSYAMFVHVSDKAGFAEFQKVEIPEDEVYVFGDNTLESSDSRVWGGVPLKNLEGRAFFRWWPPSRMGAVE